MIDFLLPVAKNDSQAQMASGLSAAGDTVQLKAGEASLFPTGNKGSATSAGSSTTLNSTGIGSKVSVGDFIRNITDGSLAWVVSVSTNSVTTTELIGGSDDTWQSSDEWLVGSFYAWLSKKDASGEDTTRELVLVEYVDSSSDQLHIETRAVEGTATAFDADDYVSVYVSAQYPDQLSKAVGEIMRRKAEDSNVVHLDGAETISDLKTFSTIPKIPTTTPTQNAEVVSKAHLDSVIAALGGAFALQGVRTDTASKRVLTWTDAIDSGTYEIQRKIGTGSFVTIETVSHTVLTFTDRDWVEGDLEYQIVAVNDEDIEYTTNGIKFNNTVYIDNWEAGFYGDGSDGAYNDSGDLARGVVHQFTDFYLTATLNFTGTGLAIVFVDGDLTITSTGIINANAAAVNSSTPTAITYGSLSPIDVSVGYGSPGNGGNGGNGGGSGSGYGIGGSGGTAGAAGTAGTAGQNLGYTPGAGGAAGAANGGSGGGGGGGGRGQYANGGYGGYGGAGGAVPNSQSHVIFIVSGNISIAGSSQLNAAGVAGGDGQNGQNGGNQPGAYGGSGGGCGGGAGVSNGGDFHFLHEGTYSNAASQGMSAGAGGAGGNGGSNGTGVVDSSATNGTAGSAGSAGSVYEYDLS